jgi:hypothetical protein
MQDWRVPDQNHHIGCANVMINVARALTSGVQTSFGNPAYDVITTSHYIDLTTLLYDVITSHPTTTTKLEV